MEDKIAIKITSLLSILILLLGYSQLNEASGQSIMHSNAYISPTKKSSKPQAPVPKKELLTTNDSVPISSDEVARVIPTPAEIVKDSCRYCSKPDCPINKKNYYYTSDNGERVYKELHKTCDH